MFDNVMVGQRIDSISVLYEIAGDNSRVRPTSIRAVYGPVKYHRRCRY